MSLHSDCCNGVSLHPYRSIIATSSGEHHALDPLDESEGVLVYENALCMWWVGQQENDPDLHATIIEAA